MITIWTSVSCHADMYINSTVKQNKKEFLTYVIKKYNENFCTLVRASYLSSVACSNEQCNTSVNLIKYGELLSIPSIILFPVQNIFHEVSWFWNLRADCLFVCCWCHSHPVGQGHLIHEVTRFHTNDAPRSVGLLWTSDQFVAETSTWHHTKITTEKHPWPLWDSNPQFQQASGRRPTP